MENLIESSDKRVLEMLSESIREMKEINKIIVDLKSELRKYSDISACNSVLRYLNSVGIERKNGKIYENLVSSYYDIESKKGDSAIKNF